MGNDQVDKPGKRKQQRNNVRFHGEPQTRTTARLELRPTLLESFSRHTARTWCYASIIDYTSYKLHKNTDLCRPVAQNAASEITSISKLSLLNSLHTMVPLIPSVIINLQRPCRGTEWVGFSNLELLTSNLWKT